MGATTRQRARLMEELLALWAMGMITGAAVWLLRSLSKHWERKHQRQLQAGGEGAGADRVADLERRLDDLAGFLEQRVSDLEERQDFAERLLTRVAGGPASKEQT